MATSPAGWFPDPGGAAGMYRYWDGSQWTPHLSAHPTAPPPGAAGGFSGYAAGTPGTSWNGTQPLGTQAPGTQPLGTQAPGPAAPGGAPAGRSRRMLPIVLVIAGLVAMALLATLVVRAMGNGGSPFSPEETSAPLPSQDPCPSDTLPSASPTQQPNDARVHGGRLSYPVLGSPWSPPAADNRVPFGRDARTQSVQIELNRHKNPMKSKDWDAWVASVLVADLVAGDGFFGPQTGAETIAKCVMGKFYGDYPVKRQDVKSEALTVDGVKGWLVEMHLTFDIPNLQTKGETAIIVVAAHDSASASLYYASIPDTSPKLLPVARDLIGQLKYQR